ncbi:MAG: diguanylate cyclase [Magnetococcales bacterium]|nr:diguanylate cyclase [Magnetococcales bacterium]
METASRKIHILLVDDQAIIGHLLKIMFSEASDLQLTPCTDPAKAIAVADEMDPTVILLDFVMPEIDGLTLLKRFRGLERYRYTPIIMLSSQEESELKANAFKEGADDYLIKLPDKVEMLSRLRSHGSRYFHQLDNLAAHQALAESEMRFRQVTQSISEAIVGADSSGSIHFWNRGAEKIFGYSEEEILGQPLTILMPDRFRSEHQMGFHQMCTSGESKLSGQNVELHGIRKDGCEFPIEFSIGTWKITGSDHFVAVMRDVTDRKKAEEQIHYQAHFDALTGVPNRNYFIKLLDQSLSLASRQENMVALLFIDLDRFKWVNDNLGHAAGDELLVQVAQRMSDCVRKSDTVARLGGDEFTVILFDIGDYENTKSIAKKILIALATPFDLAGQEAHISGSIGITFFPDDSQDRDVLLRNADHAMYIAKRSGRNAYWFFQPDVSEEGAEVEEVPIEGEKA